MLDFTDFEKPRWHRSATLPLHAGLLRCSPHLGQLCPPNRIQASSPSSASSADCGTHEEQSQAVGAKSTFRPCIGGNGRGSGRASTGEG